jgi:hypothetical protein
MRPVPASIIFFSDDGNLKYVEDSKPGPNTRIESNQAILSGLSAVGQSADAHIR